MRRRFHRGGGRRPKEPVSWLRQEIFTRNATLGLGNPLAIAVFDPELVVFGNIDTRITVRRIKLEVMPHYHISANTAAQALVFGMGVYMAGAGEPGRNPNLVTEEDQETDWLYLCHTTALVAAGVSDVFPANEAEDIRGTAYDANAPDIKTMRKLDAQQTIVCSIAVKQLNITDFTAPTITIGAMTLDASVLYSRTMRR